jgi:hypothetical protein
MLEYNDFGDPSTVIRRDVPVDLEPSFHISLSSGQVVMSSPQPGIDGAVVTLVRNGQYVGRGLITKGVVTISAPTKFTSLKGLSAIIAGDGFTSTTIGAV